MIPDTANVHNCPEVGITPRLPDLGYRYLVGRIERGEPRAYWSATPDLDPACPFRPVARFAVRSDFHNWGYTGSGPWELAFSVLLTLTGSGRVAHALAGDLVVDARIGLVKQPRDGFALPVRGIRAWLREHEGLVA